MSAWQKSLEELKREARNRKDAEGIQVDPSQIPQRVLRGWRVLVSYGDGTFNMSASLYPRGRSSKEIDWDTLGQIAKVLGAPKDPIRWPDDPNAPVHWIWKEA